LDRRVLWVLGIRNARAVLLNNVLFWICGKDCIVYWVI
jgi:hypothetical protein